jgi:enoyl-CoA hydratase/carnithine racemase
MGARAGGAAHVIAEVTDGIGWTTLNRPGELNGPALALGRAKQLIRSSLDNSWDEQSHREAEAIAEMVRTEDHQEGLAAFLEKRQPQFRGR